MSSYEEYPDEEYFSDELYDSDDEQFDNGGLFDEIQSTQIRVLFVADMLAMLSLALQTSGQQTDTAKLATATDKELMDWLAGSTKSQRDSYCDQVDTFIKEVKTPDEETQVCPICRDAKADRELPCGHQHCQGCIAEWLEHASTCPLCRKQFDEETELFPLRIMKRVTDLYLQGVIKLV